MLRLRELYQKEQHLIQRLLGEKRRKYVQSQRREQEQYGNVPVEPDRMSPEEKVSFEKFAALRRYSKIRGPEALLHQRSMDLASTSFQPKSFSKCVFSHQRGVKCGEKTVPLSKYCFKHIISDPCQVLFRTCGFDIPDGDKCQDPLFPVTEDAMCLLHSSGPECSVFKS
jgi:KAT8 regulatory NSL complex subunit 2